METIWTTLIIWTIIWIIMLTFFRSWGTSFLLLGGCLLGIVILAYVNKIYWLVYTLLFFSCLSFIVAGWWMIKDYKKAKIRDSEEESHNPESGIQVLSYSKTKKR